MILDGWGIGKHNHGDVIFETPTPFMDHLNATYPHSELLACGENVGFVSVIHFFYLATCSNYLATLPRIGKD